jgi:hypothetical protein
MMQPGWHENVDRRLGLLRLDTEVLDERLTLAELTLLEGVRVTCHGTTTLHEPVDLATSPLDHGDQAVVVQGHVLSGVQEPTQTHGEDTGLLLDLDVVDATDRDLVLDKLPDCIDVQVVGGALVVGHLVLLDWVLRVGTRKIPTLLLNFETKAPGSVLVREVDVRVCGTERVAIEHHLGHRHQELLVQVRLLPGEPGLVERTGDRVGSDDQTAQHELVCVTGHVLEPVPGQFPDPLTGLEVCLLLEHLVEPVRVRPEVERDGVFLDLLRSPWKVHHGCAS